ncbi:MAG: alpha/beta hydrolase [Oscillospiraceae bacterium]|nr:alpha/beta hydrolase [Oscillospiraceae bacterium]
MKKWLPAIPAALLAGGYWGFRHACARIEDPNWDSEAALKKTPFAEFAASIPRARQWLREHNAQDVQTASFDGLTLRGQWIHAERPFATIILFHGYHSHHLNDFAAIYGYYHSIGLNLLLVRQRAHGESDGKYITFGVNERRDALSWIDFHNRTHGVDNVFLGGMSMGASTVLFAAGGSCRPMSGASPPTAASRPRRKFSAASSKRTSICRRSWCCP